MKANTQELDSFCVEQYPSLLGLMSFYFRDKEIAEEMVQEALVRVCSDWSKVRRMDHPDRWVRRVAVNLAKSRFRRWKVELRAKKRLEGRRHEPHNDPDTADAVAVRQAVAALPHRQRAVLVLHYYLDLPLHEVAVTLDLPDGTVKSLAHRGTESLRRKLAGTNQREVANA